MKFLHLITQTIWLRYAVGLLLLIIPIYPKFPVIGVSGIYVAIRLEDFLIFALLTAWIIHKFKTTSLRELLKDNMLRVFLLFWLAGLISTIAGAYMMHIIDIKIGLLHWLRRVEYMSVFFIAFDAAREKKRLPFYIEIMFIAVIIAFLYGLGQMYLNWPVISTQNEEYSKGGSLFWTPGARLHSTFAGHYDLAAYLVLVSPLFLGFYFLLKKFWHKILFIIIVFLPSFWLLMQTSSRVSFAGYLVAGVIALWLLRRKIFIVPFLILSILGSIFLGTIGERFKFFIDLYTKPAQNILKSQVVKPVYAAESGETPQALVEDRSIEIRLNQEWPRAVRAFKKNPLIGTGYSSLNLATDNDYLRMLGETGIVGTLSFLLIIVSLVSACLLKFRGWVSSVITIEKVVVAGFIGGLFGLLVNATFIDVFEASKVAIVFWLIAGLAMGVISQHDEKSK